MVYSSLKDKALEWFWSYPTVSFPTSASLRDVFVRKIEIIVDQCGALIMLLQLKQRDDEMITKFLRRFKLVKNRCDAAQLEKNTILKFFSRIITRTSVAEDVDARSDYRATNDGCLFDGGEINSKGQ